MTSGTMQHYSRSAARVLISPNMIRALMQITEYVKTMCPHAKIGIHQTWAYSDRCKRLKGYGFTSSNEMSEIIKVAYEKAAEKIGVDLVIPSGEAFEAVLKDGITVHNADDLFHANVGAVCYLLGLIWSRTILGTNAQGNTLRDFKTELPEETVFAAQRIVDSIIL